LTPPLLAIEAISKRFGGVLALDGVCLEVAAGSICGLIGPNGSGKTTLLNIINGVYHPDSGQIRLAGEAIVGRRASLLAAAGLSRTFQNARVFQTLTVAQNMMVPLLHAGPGVRERASPRAAKLLALVGLTSYADWPASELSGGQQRLLEFARALITEPRLVLMDEPFAGVHPEIKSLLIRRIRETVESRGASFLIVSHEVPDLVAMSGSMLCLVEGKTVATGLPADVVCDESVIEGYLGRRQEPT
jgi:ABC-type branched-subunit amino acid transport system ATPase component